MRSETHVFHNGWYGYKNWGIGLACYATYHENARAAAILAGVKAEFRTRAAPALELAGDGGGRLFGGDDLYSYGGKTYPPRRNTGPAPECRMEVSPTAKSKVDYFLHVLAADNTSIAAAPEARVATTDKQVKVTIGKTAITFTKPAVGGSITINGARRTFATKNTVLQEENR